MRNTLERHLKAVALRKTGLTFKEIGVILKVKKQRAEQIYKWVLKMSHKICQGCQVQFKTQNNGRGYCDNCRKNRRGIFNRGGREQTRMLVRVRDKFTCQDCGLIRLPEEVTNHNSQIKGLKGRIKLFDIHHTGGQCGKNSRGYDAVDSLTGMVTLCHRCHFNRPEHGGRSHKKHIVPIYINLVKSDWKHLTE